MDDSGEFGLVIPYEKNEFGRFLAGLLRSPKQIEFRTAIDFFIGVDDILSIDEALFQRLKEQQRYDEVEFKVSIRYSDGLRYTYPDRSEFSKHAYISKAQPVSIDVQWVFLLHLPGESVPQKQEVQVEFSTNDEAFIYSRNLSFESISDYEYARKKGGQAGFDIRHTHVTIGSDFAAILRVLLQGFHADKSAISSILMSNWLAWVWRGVTVFSGVAAILYCVMLMNAAIIDLGGGADSVIGNGFLSISITLTLVVSVLSGVAIISLSETLLKRIRRRPPSIIALTTSERLKGEKLLSAFERRKLKIASALLVNLIVGVIGSILATQLMSSLAG